MSLWKREIAKTKEVKRSGELAEKRDALMRDFSEYTTSMGERGFRTGATSSTGAFDC